MASTFSTNLHLELQGTSEHVNTWGANLNSNSLNVIDSSMGGVQTFSLSSADVTVNTAQSQNNAFILTGLLTANVSVVFPQIGRTYYVANNTTGSFTVTLKTSGVGSTVTIAQGRSGFIVLNVADVYTPSDETGGGGMPSGAVNAFAMNTAPTGWLECAGTAVSRTTYAALFTAIGTTFGPGDGSSTFNLPDLRAYWIRGWDHGRGIDTGRVFGSNQAEMVGPHTHAVTGSTGSGGGGGGGSFDYGSLGSGPTPAIVAGNVTVSGSVTLTAAPVHSHTISLTSASNSGTENRVINVALMYCIKT